MHKQVKKIWGNAGTFIVPFSIQIRLMFRISKKLQFIYFNDSKNVCPKKCLRSLRNVLSLSHHCWASLTEKLAGEKQSWARDITAATK